MPRIEFVAENDSISARIDSYLSVKLENFTRNKVQIYIEKERIKVNGNATSKNYKLRAGDIITVDDTEPETIELAAQEIPLDIVYEDEYILVINKPKGMVVHPAAGHIEGTLVNALMYHCKDGLSGINGELRPGIVHRIDKDTSGLLVVAKCDEAHLGFSEQIRSHDVSRIYYTVCYGNFKDSIFTVDAPIGRDPKNRKKMAVIDKNSKNAITHFEVIKEFDGFTLLKAKLETGRTHQIRVHLAYIGHPVCGDEVYGPKKVITSLGGQCLHAKEIDFIHPITGEQMHFETELPDYFINFLKTLKGRTL